MNPQEFRTLLLFVAGLFIIGGSFVLWQMTIHPHAAIQSSEEVRRNTAAPKTGESGQMFYEKERAQEWAEANSGVRTTALPAWAKLLQRFRFNVVGSDKDSAMQQLADSEAWRGKITGDVELDKRIIEASVMSRFNRETKTWEDLEADLKAAADNAKISETLKAHDY